MRSIHAWLWVIALPGIAFADELPADEPPADAPPVEAEPVPVEPAPPAPMATPAPVVMDTTPTPGSQIGEPIVDDGGLSASSSTTSGTRKPPSIAFELSGAGGLIANPYVEYRGWTLETGPGRGARLEANLVGIQLAYELSSMSNDQACADTCISGSFGSTTMHSVELGYRFRFSRIGPVRPFVTASLGGVLANSGDWSMMSSKTVKGGSGRAGFGIEIPLAARLFASATLAYRVVVTENPLRDEAAETANQVLVGGDIPNGDYAEDVHLISGYVGIGVEL